MAIQFPPLAPGDPEPNDGDTYLYLVTGEEFVCRRSSSAEAAQWAAQGLVQDTLIGYRGPLFIQQPAPPADTGDIFSVADGGVADASFDGLAGQDIDQWSLVIFTGTAWLLVNSAASGPWVRTESGRIQPTVQTDDLDMADGNYLINELPDLPGGSTPEPSPDPISITLSTTTWSNTAALPNSYRFDQAACGGNNDSPALAWTVTGEIPDGATFRIRCLDASANNFVHWSVDNIPTTVLSIAENGDLPAGATANSSGFNGGEKANGWAGPCPPANTGIHNYTFTVRLVNSSGTQLAISNALVSAIPTD